MSYKLKADDLVFWQIKSNKRYIPYVCRYNNLAPDGRYYLFELDSNKCCYKFITLKSKLMKTMYGVG